MEEIPEDVRDAANKAYDEAARRTLMLGVDPVDPIARAILAERERCAGIAATATIRSLATGMDAPIMGRTIIADRIRNKPHDH